MQKRHGIIVGVTILLVALIITIISSNLKRKEKVEEEKPSLSVSQGTNDVVNGGVATENVTKPSDTNTTVNSGGTVSGSDIGKVEESNNNVSNITTTLDGDTNIFEVSSEEVANPSEVLNEIMIVANKKVMLIDLDVNSNDNKQMVYVIDMLTANGKKVSLYVNGVVYDDINVGDKLNIHYNKYINKKGVEIPLVIQATKATDVEG